MLHIPQFLVVQDHWKRLGCAVHEMTAGLAACAKNDQKRFECFEEEAEEEEKKESYSYPLVFFFLKIRFLGPGSGFVSFRGPIFVHKMAT